jgi:hypothetical protein
MGFNSGFKGLRAKMIDFQVFVQELAISTTEC